MEAGRFGLVSMLVCVAWYVTIWYVYFRMSEGMGGDPGTYTASQLCYPQHQILHLCWRDVLVAKENHTPFGD